MKMNIHDKVVQIRNAVNAVPGCFASGMVLSTSLGEVPELTINVFLNDFEDYIGSHTNIGIGVEKIIFNPPATIVFWTDDTKTVVKTMEGTEFNPYYGFCAAVTKKIFGNNNRIENCIKRKGENHSKIMSSKTACTQNGAVANDVLDLNVGKEINQIVSIEDLKGGNV